MNSGVVFVDRTKEAGVGDRGTGEDGVFADFDNDGDLDLYVVNGGEAFHNPPNVLYQNNGNGTFADVTEAAQAAGPTQGRGASVLAFDYDQDGDLDLFLTNGRGPPPYNEGPYTLLQNNTVAGHSCSIELEGATSNRFALGARVTVRAGGLLQLQERHAASSVFATSMLPLHFGLGDRTEASVEVRWTSGHVSTLVAHSSSARPGGAGTSSPAPCSSSRSVVFSCCCGGDHEPEPLWRLSPRAAASQPGQGHLIA
jgi:hypothetical protein